MRFREGIRDPAEFQGLVGEDFGGLGGDVDFSVGGGGWGVEGRGGEGDHAVPAGGDGDWGELGEQGDGGGVREVGVG